MKLGGRSVRDLMSDDHGHWKVDSLKVIAFVLECHFLYCLFITRCFVRSVCSWHVNAELCLALSVHFVHGHAILMCCLFQQGFIYLIFFVKNLIFS